MILITGGSGLLGSHLLLNLVKNGEKVRAIVRSDESVKKIEKVFSWYDAEYQSLSNQIQWVKGDVLDLPFMMTACQGIQKVYHTAAIVSYKKKEKSKIIKENAQMAAYVVNACLHKQVEKLCHISSIAALGDQESPITEETAYEMTGRNSAYSLGKYRAELEVWRGMAEGLNAVILNPSVIIGPGDWDRSSAALFKTVYKGMRFYTEGTTGFVDVRDVAACAMHLMDGKTSSQRFIISSQNLDYFTLFSFIAKNLGKKPPAIKIDPSLAQIAVAAEQFRTFFTGKSPVITRETARISQKKLAYSSEKIIQETKMKMIPINESIAHTAKIFLSEVHNHKS